MPAPALRLLPALALLAAAACGPPPPAPDLLRLDVDLAPVVTHRAPAQIPLPVLRGCWPAAPDEPALTVATARRPERGAVRLEPFDPAAPDDDDDDGGQRVLLLDVEPGELLRVRVQLEHPFGESPGLVVPLARRLPLDARTSRPTARALLHTLRADGRALQPTADGTRAGRLVAIPADGRQLAVLLNTGAATRRLVGARVERLSLAAWRAAEGPRPHVVRPREGARPPRVKLDRDDRRALRLVPDTTLAWTLPEHVRPWTFEAAVGLARRPREAPGAVQLELLADGAPLHEQRFTGSADLAEPAWRPLRVALPAGTRRLELRAHWPAGDGPVTCLAHPRLRRPRRDPPPNLLLVSLDTLRADRLGLHGGPAPSPHLDAFAEQALVFERAYAPSSYTLPGHATLLSGQLPALHGARDLHDRVDAERTPLLAPLLAEAGYVTAAFTGGGFFSAAFGFSAGFDRYSHNDPCWPVDTERGRMLLGLPSEGRRELALLQRSGVEHVNAWLARQPPGAPFFALVHTYATHDYAPSREWMERAGLVDADGRERPFDHGPAKALRAGDTSLRAEVREQFTTYYDATVGTADAFVGELLAGLERAGLADSTVVVITSDHGEELGEHDSYGHARNLREGVTRVPLLVRVPGRAPARIDAPVSSADLAPWLLELLGQPVDPRMRPPRALAADAGDPPARSTLLFDLGAGRSDLWALREGDLKLVHDANEDSWVLHDLSTPGGEAVDVSAEHPERLARLRHKLEGYRAMTEARAAQHAGEADLDPETRRQLAQLGYLDADDG